MSSPALPEFEAQLRQVVTAKRLSSSKMTALTELALENMQADTQMISLMYRLHKGLPTSNKVSSLYVFDSISRAAHRQRSKKALVADLNSSVGNAASFLVRLEGILDGLVEDMLAHGPPEAKEKTRKVLDIWTREGTFPAGALTRLSERVKKGDSYSQGTTARFPQTINTAPPQQQVEPPPISTPVAANGIASLPPAILALLGSAVPTTPIATQPIVTPPPVPVELSPPPPQQFTLDPTQLALISQLTAQAPPFHSPPPPPPPPFSPVRQGSDYGSGNGIGDFRSPRSRSRTRSPSRERRWRDGPRDPRARNGAGRYGREDEYDRPRGYRDDDRPPPRRFRDDDRSGPRFRDRDEPRAAPPFREDPRRRRSRSPARAYSGEPDRNGRGSVGVGGSGGGGSGRAPLPGAGEKGKDEFGRDIRSASPDSAPGEDTKKDGAFEKENGNEKRQDAEMNPPVEFTPVPPPVYSPTQPSEPLPQPGAPLPQVGAAGGTATGLAAFDMSTFDFTDPGAWAKLAAAWEETNGRSPTQEEMMVFVAGGGVMGGAPGGGNAMGVELGGDPSGGQGGQWDQSGWNGGGGGRGRGRGGRGFRARGRGRGRGGGGGFGGYNGGYGGGNEYGGYGQDGGLQGDSDAVVLGGGDDSGNYAAYDNSYQNGNGAAYNQNAYGGGAYGQTAGGAEDTSFEISATSAPEATGGGGGGGGGMKRVDGKWVWSKN